MAEDYLFDILTPLGFRVHVTADRWKVISEIKHPVLLGRIGDVSATLETPDEVRRSRQDETVLLFYRSLRSNRWMCAVVKVLDTDGFLITAYPTDAIKIGEQLWKR